jgi:hypothetical protein
MFDVGRSMFDVQSFQGSEPMKSHMSAASGQKNGQFNRNRNSEKANNEYRILLRRTVSKE